MVLNIILYIILQNLKSSVFLILAEKDTRFIFLCHKRRGGASQMAFRGVNLNSFIKNTVIWSLFQGGICDCGGRQTTTTPCPKFICHRGRRPRWHFIFLYGTIFDLGGQLQIEPGCKSDKICPYCEFAHFGRFYLNHTVYGLGGISCF